jgi:L-asparaginase
MQAFIPLALATLAVASPVSQAVAAITSSNKTASERLGLEWISDNSSLSKVLILFTGGTLVGGSAYSGLDDTQYGQIQITAEELIARDPYLATVANLAVSNWTTTTGDSTGTSDPLVMNMTRFAHDALCSPDSDIVGAVFTHGTNSLEETAFLMDLLVNCHKPVVGVGAMRPWTDISFDGDANFFQAVALAASPDSRDRGVLVRNTAVSREIFITDRHRVGSI